MLSQPKALTINLSFGVDYEFYISDYIMSIKASDDDKYDMMTIKNSKVLF